MKIPAYIIDEQKRRNEEKRQREERDLHLPLTPPEKEYDDMRSRRKEEPKRGMIEIEL
jgi:hypothetical protein